MKIWDAIPGIGLATYYCRNSDTLGRALGDGDRSIDTTLTDDLTRMSRRFKFLAAYNIVFLGIGIWKGIELLASSK